MEKFNGGGHLNNAGAQVNSDDIKQIKDTLSSILKDTIQEEKPMKVILIKDDEKLGELGDEITVKDGYARNFLIPRKIVKLKTEPDNVFTGEDEKAYEEAMIDYEKGEYIEMEDYMKKRGLSV